MREKIKLESSAGTGHFYTTNKNRRPRRDKLVMKKYDRWPASTSDYKETKLSKPAFSAGFAL